MTARLFALTAFVLLTWLPYSAYAEAKPDPEAKECRETHESIACRYYSLDDVMGHSYALYPGSLYRSYIAPKDEVASFADLEERISALPLGTIIIWNPALRTHEGAPVLFGNAENVKALQVFCKAHNITLEIGSFACRDDEECKSYCQKQDPQMYKRCSAPTCLHQTCLCWDACR